MKRRILLGTLFAIVISVLLIGAWMIGAFAHSPAPPGEQLSRANGTFSVATYNIFFASNHHEIEDVIRSVDADIICLQETTKGHQKYFASALTDEYPYQNEALSSIHNGPMILSKFPLRNCRYEESEAGINGFAICETKVSGQWVQIINIHLQPIIAVGLTKWNELAKIHRREAAQIHGMLDDQKPTLIAGDFNAFHNSAAPAFLAKQGFRDVFAEVNSNAESHPTIAKKAWGITVRARIDFLFRNAELVTRAARVFDGDPSDHHGVVARFELRP